MDLSQVPAFVAVNWRCSLTLARRIGVFEQICCLLARHLRVGVPDMRDALLCHLTKCLWHFRVH